MPVPRAAAIDRPRLIERMAIGPDRAALTVIHGGAGMGKSTLARQWTRRQIATGLPVVSLSLVEPLTQEASFWAQLAEVVTTQLRDNQAVSAPAGHERKEMLDWLSSVLEPHSTILIDGLELLAEPWSTSVVMSMVQNIPHLHVMVATRSYSPLASVDTAALFGTLLLTSDDLAMTQAEGELLAQRLGLPVRMAERIVQRASGWPLLVHAWFLDEQRLLGLGSAAPADGDRFAIPRFIEVWLDSLLLEQDADSRLRILAIALAGSASLAEATELAGASPRAAAEVLRWFESMGLGQFGPRGRVMHVHAVVQERYSAVAKSTLPSAGYGRILSTRARQLWQREPDTALGLALAAGDMELSSTIAGVTSISSKFKDPHLVRGMMHSLPPQVGLNYPSLLMLELNLDFNEPGTSAQWLNSRFQALKSALRDKGTHQGQPTWILEVLKARVFRLFGENDEALRHANGFLLEVGRTPPSDLSRYPGALTSAYAQAALCFAFAGENRLAAETLVNARSADSAKVSPGKRLELIAIEAALNADRGDLESAEIALAAGHMHQSDWPPGADSAAVPYLLAEAVVHLGRLQPTKAIERLDVIMRQWPDTEYWPYVADVLSTAHFALTGPRAASAILRQLIDNHSRRPAISPALKTRLNVRLVELATLGGRASWATEENLAIKHVRTPRARLARALGAWSRGKSDQALGVARELEWHPEMNARQQNQARMLIVLASIEKDREAAVEALSTGLESMRALRDLAPLLILPPKVVGALAPLFHDRELRTLKALRGCARISGPTGDNASLSPAERRTLMAIGAGRSPAEAAEFLNLSVHTIRYHLKRIYKKLGVSSRQEMIRVAAQQGLLGE